MQEIIIDGRDLGTIAAATQAAIAAAKDTPDLLTISSGNYGGRLGNNGQQSRRQRRHTP